jgi:hypothetical protein
MFSAMDDVKDKVEGLELGADDYITKPFNFSEVLARIRAVLRTRELIHQIERREARISAYPTRSRNACSASLTGLRAPSSTSRATRKPLAPNADRAGPFVERTKGGAARHRRPRRPRCAAVASLKAEADSLKKDETALHAIKTKYRGHPEQ